MSVKQKVLTALEKLGHTNGTAAVDKGNVNALLHEYFIASTMSSYAEKRRDAAKKAIADYGINVDAVKAGDTVNVLSSKEYTLAIKAANPPWKVDITAFMTSLTKQGVKKHIIDKAEADATSKGTSAKTWVIAPIE